MYLPYRNVQFGNKIFRYVKNGMKVFEFFKLKAIYHNILIF